MRAYFFARAGAWSGLFAYPALACRAELWHPWRGWRVMIHGAEDRPPSQNRILDGAPCGNSSLGHRYCRNAEVLRLRRPIRSANRSASLRMTR
jgi:hypothetical protein